MDYTNQPCPKCGNGFEKDEDIVVCPICGTPQHRSCYNELCHCVNEEKHSQNYNWSAEHGPESEENREELVCKLCHTANSDDAVFCKKCGSPLIIESSSQEKSESPFSQAGQQTGQTPFSFQNPFFTTNPIDKDDDIGNGVTVDEAAKLIKVNTPYYIPLFTRIKNQSKSRFNFAGFFCSGAWFLYRKQYLKGAILTAIVALTFIVSIAFQARANEVFTQVVTTLNLSNGISTSEQSRQLLSALLFGQPIEQAIAIWVPLLANALRFVIMVFCGATANRSYYKHCIKTVNEIKAATPANLDNELSSKGGVNNAIALSMFACYIIISFISSFLI